MEREQLVGPRFGDEQRCGLRWRCRAARCMRAAISRRRAAARPITSRNGTGAVGRPLGSGMNNDVCMRWRCRAARCMRAAISRRRVAARPMTLRNGTGAVGQPLGSGMNGGVDALAVSGSTLYAGGDFTTAGGSAANDIAQWNGSSWSAARFGDEQRRGLRWRCRAARCMRAAISRRRAAARPITSRNGTGAVGRPSVRG